MKMIILFGIRMIDVFPNDSERMHLHTKIFVEVRGEFHKSVERDQNTSCLDCHLLRKKCYRLSAAASLVLRVKMQLFT